MNIGIEIYHSLKYSRHINLIGANSVEDSGRLFYDKYYNNIPFVNEKHFISEISKLVKKENIDAIYPTMDSAISILKVNESEIGCSVIASSKETTLICESKKLTYKLLRDFIKCPKVYDNNKDLEFPLFIKPNNGYGSRRAYKVNNKLELKKFSKELGSNKILTEFLPGEEYTIDCFTDFNGVLKFIGPRPRKRTRIGISVNTESIDLKSRSGFNKIANEINKRLKFNGAWFFQVKKNNNDEYVLLEIASRIAGSSSLYKLSVLSLILLVY